MKQKIYDIPIWDAYAVENVECPLCLIQKNMEADLMNILFDDMLMTPYFAVKLQQYRFCSEHYRKLYISKDKLGLALIVNNFLQCEKEQLQNTKRNNMKHKKLTLIDKLKSNKKKRAQTEYEEKKCYLCDRIDENMPDYIEVLLKLWSKEKKFRLLYENSKGHCFHHYNMLINASIHNLPSKDYDEFNNITTKLQLDNTNRLIEELDWFVCKYDYRYKDEPWKNSKDALPRCINKLNGYIQD
jgi:hypothetical protein